MRVMARGQVMLFSCWIHPTRDIIRRLPDLERAPCNPLPSPQSRSTREITTLCCNRERGECNNRDCQSSSVNMGKLNLNSNRIHALGYGINKVQVLLSRVPYTYTSSFFLEVNTGRRLNRIFCISND